MAVFRSFAFYLSILGLVFAVFLIQKMGAPPPESIPLAEPAVNPYSYTIAASGLIEAADKNLGIGVAQPGLIKKVLIGVNDNVQIGQPLFEMDDRELQGQLTVQQANIKIAEATLKRLENQLARLQNVKDARAVSQEEVDTRVQDVNVARAQLQLAEAQAEQTRILINRLTVCSPIRGCILQSNIRTGEYAQNSAPAMIIGNLERLQVRADIDEQNAAHVVSHLQATAFPKNNTQLSIPLQFEWIEPYVVPKRSLTGASDEKVDTRVLQVIYSFEKPANFPLYVGQQVDVFIERIPENAEAFQSETLITQ